MEIQIQDLVASIKRDGIEEAQKQAAQIVEKANAEAGEIVAKAKNEAKKSLDDANREIAVLRQSAQASVAQAKRDVVLSLKKELQSQFDRLLSQYVGKNVKGEILSKLISQALAGQDVSKVRVEIAQVNDAVKAELAQEIKNGLEIKPVKNVSAGFKICEKDGSGYFDFSEESIAEMLKPFLGDLVI